MGANANATGKVTGTISAINTTTPLGVADANSAVEISLGGKQDTLAIQVTGTYAVSALSLQVTQDGTNWVTVAGASALVKHESTGSATIPAAATGIWKTDISGVNKARVTALGAITGSAVVTMIGGRGTA